jgi:membrane protease YdiL (CAAX protease family)
MDVELSPAATEFVNVIVGSVVLSSVIAWIVLSARLWYREPMMSFRPRRPVPWGLVHVGVIGVIYLGLEIAAASWVGLQIREETGQDDLTMILDPRWMPMYFGAAAAAKVMALAIGMAVLYLAAGANGDDLGLGMKGLIGQVMLGIAAFLTLAPPVFAIQKLTSLVVPYEHSVIELLLEDASRGNLLLTTALVVLVAPLVEEFLFRLVLQGWLQRFEWFNRGGPQIVAALARESDEEVVVATPVEQDSTGPVAVDGISSAENPFVSPAAVAAELPPSEPAFDPACDPNDVPMRPVLPMLGVVPICISSLVFAMMHIGQGAAPIPLFVFALGLGYLYQRTGRLLPCIIVHMLLNGTSMAIIWLSVYNPA